MISQALSGGSAGFITAVSTNPMDIVRTKAQVYTQYGAIDTFKYIIQRDGARGLMTGVSAVRPPWLLLSLTVSLTLEN